MAWDAGGHIIGVLANEPRLKVLDSGSTVANFTVEAVPRHYDKETGQWREVAPVRVRCNAWHSMAHHVANSLHKGDRVVVIGRLKNNDYTDVNGVERNYLEYDVDAIGPDLRYNDVKVLN